MSDEHISSDEKPIRRVNDRLEVAVRYPVIASVSHNGAVPISAASSMCFSRTIKTIQLLTL